MLHLNENFDLFVIFQGWSSSADPRKRDPSVLHMEAEGMKKEITEHDERKKLEHLDLKSDV